MVLMESNWQSVVEHGTFSTTQSPGDDVSTERGLVKFRVCKFVLFEHLS